MERGGGRQERGSEGEGKRGSGGAGVGERGRQADADLLLHSLVHSLFEPCVCPDPRPNTQPRHTGRIL